MELLDRIKSIFRKNNNKLLGDGSENTKTQEDSLKKNKFKDRIAKEALENLTPEQWQIKFLTENNMNMKKYLDNPFIAKFLLSIPEIAGIKDKESFKKAKKGNEGELNFAWDEPILTFNSKNENALDDNVIITCKPTKSTYIIEVERKNSGLYSRNKKIEERRTYDLENNVEIERYKRSRLEERAALSWLTMKKSISEVKKHLD